MSRPITFTPPFPPTVMVLVWMILVVLLASCSASLPPTAATPGQSIVTCARSAPIMGWGGGTVFTVVIDATHEGGSFKTTADCGGIEAVMNPTAVPVPATATKGTP